MCCYKDKLAEQDFVARFGKRQTVVMWKELRPNGVAQIEGKYQYRIGVNRSDLSDAGRYNATRPRGIHVYLYADDNITSTDEYERNVAVICHRQDFVRADWNQAVFTEVTIRRKDWEAAGLPSRKRKRK